MVVMEVEVVGIMPVVVMVEVEIGMGVLEVGVVSNGGLEVRLWS